MLQSILVTLSIIAINILFFYFGFDDSIAGNSYIAKEILHSIYKIFAYAGPMLLILYMRDKSNISKEFRGQFLWCNKIRTYAVWMLWFLLLIIGKKSMSVDFGAYTLFYVLIVNSVVEESVFRGYIQDKLVGLYGKVTGIIGQAILFGVAHLPFYYTAYQAGLYNAMNQSIGGFFPISGLGLFVILFSIGTPIMLGLLWGWTTDKTKSLRPAIVWHSIHNGVLLFL